jgi:hypothetical protein
MDSLSKTINQLIKSIDWIRIKSIHKKLNILWEFEDDKQTVTRVPTVGELKDEFRALIQHMNENDLNYVSYENWIVFWEKTDDQPFGSLRAVFRLLDYSFSESEETESEESLSEDLNAELKIALDNEDYEYAALIRDELKKKQKHK